MVYEEQRGQATLHHLVMNDMTVWGTFVVDDLTGIGFLMQEGEFCEFWDDEQMADIIAMFNSEEGVVNHANSDDDEEGWFLA